MKVFIIAALTIDGFIAQSSDQHVSWTSPEDKAFYREKTKQSGVMIFGANTFATIGRALPGRRTIVLTHHPENITTEGVEATSETPQAVIERLASEGVEKLAICGGASIYRLFLEAGVVDELFVTIEPLVFGQGISLFDKPLEQRFELVDVNRPNDSTLLLHYKVVK